MNQICPKCGTEYSEVHLVCKREFLVWEGPRDAISEATSVMSWRYENAAYDWAKKSFENWSVKSVNVVEEERSGTVIVVNGTYKMFLIRRTFNDIVTEIC